MRAVFFTINSACVIEYILCIGPHHVWIDQAESSPEYIRCVPKIGNMILHGSVARIICSGSIFIPRAFGDIIEKIIEDISFRGGPFSSKRTMKERRR